VEGLSILANEMSKAVAQAPCDLRNEVHNFAQKEGENLGAAWSRYNQLALSDLELSISDAMFM
jgi:hypothetical protein